jgi:hypothetical protein
MDDPRLREDKYSIDNLTKGKGRNRPVCFLIEPLAKPHETVLRQ